MSSHPTNMRSNEAVLLFIEDLRSNECLWNVTSVLYKNRSGRRDAIDCMSKKFNISASEVEKKISNLKSQFRREHKKLSNLKRNGLSLKRTTWFAYEALLFLLQVQSSRGTRRTSEGEQSSLNDQTEECNKQEEASATDSQSSCEETHQKETAGSSQTHGRSNVSFRTPKIKFHSKKRALTDNRNETPGAALKYTKSWTEAVSKRDDFAVYGEHIANKLRTSGRSHREVAIAQNHIDQICFNLIMGEYYEQGSKYVAS